MGVMAEMRRLRSRLQIMRSRSFDGFLLAWNDLLSLRRWERARCLV
jgi:hypothetical protein